MIIEMAKTNRKGIRFFFPSGRRKTTRDNKIGVTLKNEMIEIRMRKIKGLFLIRKTKASHTSAASKMAGFPAVIPMIRVLLKENRSTREKIKILTQS